MADWKIKLQVPVGLCGPVPPFNASVTQLLGPITVEEANEKWVLSLGSSATVVKAVDVEFEFVPNPKVTVVAADVAVLPNTAKTLLR